MIAVGALAIFAWQRPPDGVARGEDLVRFAGRLHPTLLHLPIGLLVLMPILDLFGGFRRARHLWATGQLVLWLATLGTIVAAITGYLLARFDGNSGEDVIDHQWAGITTAAGCCVALMFRSLARGGAYRKVWSMFYVLAIGFTLVGLVYAGHLGGNISHGDAYLSEYAPRPVKHWLNELSEDHDQDSEPTRRRRDEKPQSIPTTEPSVQVNGESNRPIETVDPTQTPKSSLPLEQRAVFASIVQPIFLASCVECHGSRKSKAGLRLDSFAHVIAGGESGNTVVPGNIADSELARRISLERTDEDAMPPKKKQGLSPDQIEAVKWWIANGASETLTIGQAANLPDAIRALAQ